MLPSIDLDLEACSMNWNFNKILEINQKEQFFKTNSIYLFVKFDQFTISQNSDPHSSFKRYHTNWGRYWTVLILSFTKTVVSGSELMIGKILKVPQYKNTHYSVQKLKTKKN